MKMGRQVGDVAARLVPDGRDADVARHIVTAARLQFGEEGADAAARLADVVDPEQAVVGAERVDQLAAGEHLYLCFPSSAKRRESKVCVSQVRLRCWPCSKKQQNQQV